MMLWLLWFYKLNKVMMFWLLWFYKLNKVMMRWLLWFYKLNKVMMFWLLWFWKLNEVMMLWLLWFWYGWLNEEINHIKNLVLSCFILFSKTSLNQLLKHFSSPFQLHPGAALCQRLENTVNTSAFSSSSLQEWPQTTQFTWFSVAVRPKNLVNTCGFWSV